MPKMGYFSIVMNVKAGTGDVHFLCTDLVGCSVEEIVGSCVGEASDRRLL